MILSCSYIVQATRQKPGLSFTLNRTVTLNWKNIRKLSTVSVMVAMTGDPHAVADLMLYYVEETASLPANYGDFGEAYSISLENNYIKAIEYIASNGMMKEFTPRIKKLIKDSDACGYGLSDVFQDY